MWKAGSLPGWETNGILWPRASDDELNEDDAPIREQLDESDCDVDHSDTVVSHRDHDSNQAGEGIADAIAAESARTRPSSEWDDATYLLRFTVLPHWRREKVLFDEGDDRLIDWEQQKIAKIAGALGLPAFETQDHWIWHLPRHWWRPALGALCDDHPGWEALCNDTERWSQFVSDTSPGGLRRDFRCDTSPRWWKQFLRTLQEFTPSERENIIDFSRPADEKMPALGLKTPRQSELTEEWFRNAIRTLLEAILVQNGAKP